MNEELSPKEIRALAAEVAERIVRDPSLTALVTGQAGGGLVCPPKKLCCFLGYNCQSPFTCQKDFRCPQGFATGLGNLYPF